MEILIARLFIVNFNSVANNQNRNSTKKKIKNRNFSSSLPHSNYDNVFKIIENTKKKLKKYSISITLLHYIVHQPRYL